MGGIVVLDFGSQFTQLIIRCLSQMNVYSQIAPYGVQRQWIQDQKPQGIVLSGGPLSVNDDDSPKRNISELLDIAPVMGICYGMQLIAQHYGGQVEKAQVREYGSAQVFWESSLPGVSKEQKVWMSHGDIVSKCPLDLKILARSSQGHPAALGGERVFAVQFHPEVSHTQEGLNILKYFTFKTCKIDPLWKPPKMLDKAKSLIRQKVGEKEEVLVALSGGVDSTVAACLCTEVLGPHRVHCVFIDNGLLRKGEYEEVLGNYKTMGLNVRGFRRGEEFLKNLKGVEDPEEKRKIIGNTFIKIFEKCVTKLEIKTSWLVQGTLYPDVIESVSVYGSSVTIKTHHNVGGLPEKMNFKLLEPLRDFFKDEVRALGQKLHIEERFLQRHPFPGPGLAIRILGEVTPESLKTLQEADFIFIDELKKEGLYSKIWQAFCVLLSSKSVGVQGDERTYSKVLALRAVTSVDAMTAHWCPLPHGFLEKVSDRITNQVRGVNRVVYDVTSKPPGTIEWE